MGWNGSTEKSVNQDHLVSDDSALSPPNDPQSIYNANYIYFQCHFRIFLAAPHLHFFTKLKKKIEMYTHGVQQNIKSNFKRIRSYMYLVQPNLTPLDS